MPNGDIKTETNRGTGECVLVFGASGTIGQAVVRMLIEAGYEVMAFMRRSKVNEALATELVQAGVSVRFGDVTDPTSIRSDAFARNRFPAVISCLASRTGSPKDAAKIDFQANLHILEEAMHAGTEQFVLLSAICVQKPRLAFQHAKLRFERRLQVSGLKWSIIRPTAFFKSLSGQIEKVRAGKPFVVFGNGELTRCKPISDADLARYLVSCLKDSDKQNRILPIGGPGPALSPKEHGKILFTLTAQEPRYRNLSPEVLRLLSAILTPFSLLSSWASEKREYLRIAHYYATESMLVWDHETCEYSADATSAFGRDTLEKHYQELLSR